MSDLKWSYMDHWLTDSPRGPVWPLHARPYMDRYIVARFLAELDAAGYDGWRIVESDHSPHPAETAMHNTWFLRHEAGVKPS